MLNIPSLQSMHYYTYSQLWVYPFILWCSAYLLIYIFIDVYVIILFFSHPVRAVIINRHYKCLHYHRLPQAQLSLINSPEGHYHLNLPQAMALRVCLELLLCHHLHLLPSLHRHSPQTPPSRGKGSGDIGVFSWSCAPSRDCTCANINLCKLSHDC